MEFVKQFTLLSNIENFFNNVCILLTSAAYVDTSVVELKKSCLERIAISRQLFSIVLFRMF